MIKNISSNKKKNTLNKKRNSSGFLIIHIIIIYLVMGGTITGCFSIPAGAGKMIEVDSHSLWLFVSGKGSPTVILESGIGDGGSFGQWKAVQKASQKLTQVLLYDRAGIGNSEPGPQPRDTGTIVTELHNLLQKAEIKPPYILVGHSMGGLHVQVFAETYPEEVAGMILVDPSPKEFLESLSSEKLTDLAAMNVPPGALAEIGEGLDNSLDRFAITQPLAHIPLIVLSSSYHEDPTGEVTYELYLQLIKYHQQLAESVNDGKHIIATDSGHYIQTEQPQLVIKAISEMILKVK